MSNGSPTPRRRPPGFRCSFVDGLIILVMTTATVLLWNTLDSTVLLLPIVLGHFFLFCNVFRVRQNYELIWAGVFVINVAAWAFTVGFNWWGILLVQMPVTLAFIVLEIKSPQYHGVGYSQINPSGNRSDHGQ